MVTLNISIAANADDGWVEVLAGTDFNNAQAVVRMGNNGGASIWNTWLRFANVTVPVGATIDVAYITLDGQFAEGANVETVIAGVDEDDHAAPTTYATWNTDHGIHTTATVTWDFAPGTAVHNTASIVTIVQEIIERGGWASGQAMGFHIDDDSSANDNRESAESLEGAGQEPILHIEYTEANAAVTRRVISSPRYGITRSARR